MTGGNVVEVMNQNAGPSNIENAGVVRSSLAHAFTRSSNRDEGNSDAQATVTLEEQAVPGLLMLRAVASADALSAALQSAYGVPLPSLLQSVQNEDYCVRWMSPDCWLISCALDETFTIETTLRRAVEEHFAIVDVSGGYCVLHLSGASAINVLKKSTGYDTHPDNFSAGKVVNTTFAKAQVTLRAVNAEAGHECYEIIVRRSFADYVFKWIQQAGEEYALSLQP